MDDFWASTHSNFSSEADVETRFVLPLLLSLDHPLSNIRSKQPIVFQEGRNRRAGRKPEADFVVYADIPHCRATALIVVETKHPAEKLEYGKDQAESYAQNLRTPIYVLTNGIDLEVWQLQLIGECELILRCDVQDLADRRGDIEASASREALIALCERLRFKSITDLSKDLSAYGLSEISRYQRDLQGHVSFSLQRYDTDGRIPIGKFLDELQAGAVIVGSSGFGKTLLSKAISLHALENWLEGASDCLPIEVFLPDVSQEGLEHYFVERVRAHSPSFNSSRLKQEAHSNGLLIVADGFERVSTAARGAVTSQLRNFIRDHPKSRLIVFSRPNCLPDLALPLLRLTGFSEDDVLSLIRAGSDRSNFGIGRTTLPLHLKDLCRIPLLGNLVAAHYRRHSRFPTKIGPLYEEWLNRVLNPFPAMERAFFRDFLERLAEKTVREPLDISACLEIAEGIGRAGLSDLADAEAISVRGTQVELIHEGLADFLRSQRLVRLPPHLLQDALNQLDFDPSSMLPGLLLTSSPSDEVSRIIWRTLADKTIELALSSLKFTIGDGERRQVPDATSTAVKVLTDALEAIECIIGSNFSERFGQLIQMVISGHQVERLGLEGDIRQGFLQYAGFDAGSAGPCIRVGPADDARRRFGIALDKQGYDAEAGRVLGATRVRDAINELIRFRWFKGGPIWTEEIVFGQLRHMARCYGFKAKPPYDLVVCRKALSGWEGRRLGSSRNSRLQLIDISELLMDVEWLISSGHTQLEEWWIEPSKVDLANLQDREQLTATLDMFHRRCQLAYSEIVERNLPGLSSLLPEYACIPMRYDLEATVAKTDIHEQLTLDFHRWPVRDIEDAGARVSFPERSSLSFSRESMDAYVKRSEELLAQFGRSRGRYHIVKGGASVPRFDGRTYMHDRNDDETAVVSAVMKMLSNDLKQVFDAIPSFRWS